MFDYPLVNHSVASLYLLKRNIQLYVKSNVKGSTNGWMTACPPSQSLQKMGTKKLCVGVCAVPREVGVLGVLQHPLSEALSYHRKRSFLKTPAKVEISENAGYVLSCQRGETGF